jgi:probable addiction module antidote protein
MPKRTGNFNVWRLEKLTDPANAANFLNAAREESLEIFLDALGDVIQARNVSAVAKEVGMARESIYRSFSSAGNPTLGTLDSILSAIGLTFKIDVVRVDEPAAERAIPGLETDPNVGAAFDGMSGATNETFVPGAIIAKQLATIGSPTGLSEHQLSQWGTNQRCA